LTNPSMGSLPGSLIQRETRSSYGSRLKANEQARLDENTFADAGGSANPGQSTPAAWLWPLGGTNPG
jgi:hypothetical protein